MTSSLWPLTLSKWAERNKLGSNTDTWREPRKITTAAPNFAGSSYVLVSDWTLGNRAFSTDPFFWAICYVYRCLFEECKTAEGTKQGNKNKHLKIILDWKYTFHLKVLPKSGSQSLCISKIFHSEIKGFPFTSFTTTFPPNLHPNHGNLFSYNSTDLAGHRGCQTYTHQLGNDNMITFLMI